MKPYAPGPSEKYSRSQSAEPTKNINDDREEAPMKIKMNKSKMKLSQSFSRWAVIFIMK
jgi:hypothetical protein